MKDKVYVYMNLKVCMCEGLKDDITLFSNITDALKKFDDDVESLVIELRKTNEEMPEEEFDALLCDYEIERIDNHDGYRLLEYCDYDGNEYIFSIQVKEVE